MPLHPVEFLRSVPLGTRVVVRTRIPGGFTDALGYLRERSESAGPSPVGQDPATPTPNAAAATCTIETRRAGLVTVLLADVTAAKAVPEPPLPRARRVS